jgi:hypothetical protein
MDIDDEIRNNFLKAINKSLVVIYVCLIVFIICYIIFNTINYLKH